MQRHSGLSHHQAWRSRGSVLVLLVDPHERPGVLVALSHALQRRAGVMRACRFQFLAAPVEKEQQSVATLQALRERMGYTTLQTLQEPILLLLALLTRVAALQTRADGKQLCCRFRPGTDGARHCKFADLTPKQAYLAFRNRHWQSPGRYYKKLPNSPVDNPSDPNSARTVHTHARPTQLALHAPQLLAQVLVALRRLRHTVSLRLRPPFPQLRLPLALPLRLLPRAKTPVQRERERGPSRWWAHAGGGKRA
jgi:hypothetical protein